MRAETHNTNKVFTIIDHRIFHNAKSVCPFHTDIIFTKNSGAEVPKATTVSPIIKLESQNFAAIPDAPSISISAHLIRKINQISI